MPKRRFSTSSFVRAAVAAVMISAASGAAHGYFQAPVCVAKDQGGLWNWYAVYDSVAMGWVYYFLWSDNWLCNTGMLSLCQMCWEAEWDYWGTQTGSWIQLSDTYLPSNTYTCNTNNLANLQDNCPPTGYLTSGVTYRIVAYDCPWNPSFPGCSPQVQNYKQIWTYSWTCPPPMPEP
jgi:hypothetical protein